MKWKRYVLLLAAAALLRLEHTGVDIGKLEPVALVQITASESGVMLRTDTGAKGTGDTLEEAAADLKSSTTAGVFLDTADFLIINKEAQALLPEVWELLRPACRVCIAGGRLDLTQARDYLAVHPPGTTLLELRAGAGEPQILTIRDGRGTLAGG